MQATSGYRGLRRRPIRPSAVALLAPTRRTVVGELVLGRTNDPTFASLRRIVVGGVPDLNFGFPIPEGNQLARTETRQ
jgi:hypothetical protein